jgi:hypothetical protein
MEEDVGCVRSVTEILNLVDCQDVWTRIGFERLMEMPLVARVREFLDQLGCGRRQTLETILDRPVSDGDS